ncbi:MAG: hypothetical protein BA865_14435 [Desulfobacterales bacterium S5133MH4]|nr:MAG: hypothetical protein BA865_14435 [Desulfobacterales bacterium S5133MH4]
MAIHLYFSNQLEQLADKLAAIVDLENQEKENIFEGPLTIVPNPNLIKWLQLTLAKKRSIFMNVDFQYLESGLWGLLARLDSGDEKPEMIDNAFLEMVLLYELQNLKRDETEFAPVSRYLLGPDGGKGPDYALKLWQLSEKIVHLFQEYEFHRSEMIQRWCDDKDKLLSMELCQQKLYLRMRELRDRYCQRTKKRLLSMAEYADEVFSQERADLTKTTSKGFVHFFGLSQVSAFHLRLIDRLKDYYDIFIYALNPSREFWEDIKTPQEKRWIQRKKVKKLEIKPWEIEHGQLLDQDDNDLLALWGKPGRESIRLLCQLTDYDFNACFTKETNVTNILRRIQDDILTLSGAKHTIERLPQDKSLQIVACPSIYREVETVYNSVLYNLEKNSRLQLTDIAILVPDISKYKPVFDSVFNREPRCLSYNLVDSRANIESVYGQAVLGILGLATGRFSRKEVFDLILNPCFMRKWDIVPEEISVWADWAVSLNIFHTFDRESKKARGYQASSYYTWKQGLQRLRLSRILSAPDEGTVDSSKHFHELAPFYDINTGDVDLVEKFSMVVEKLHHAATDLNRLHVSGEEWKQKLMNICDNLLEIPSGFRGENAVQHALIEAFNNLKIYDQLLENRSGKDWEKPKLDIELIREFVKSNLNSISGGYGDYLTGGVTISALQPMRPIPFQIVYVLGMEDGAFPGRADTSSLDLRILKRQIGDISLPERNCYLFLEMLLSVRDKLYISFVSKDLQRDRILQPSSVVNQLRRYMEQETLEEGRLFRITDIPLRGSSREYLDRYAISEISDVLVNYSLSDRIAYYQENRLWEQVSEKASKDQLKDVERFWPDLTVDAKKPEKDERIVEKITLKQLKKFLEDPVTQSIKRHLGLYDEEETIEEIILGEDEPFCSEFPVNYKLKIEPLKQWLDSSFSSKDGKADKQLPGEIYDRIYDCFRRNGSTPEGAFAEADKYALRDEVLVRAKTLSSVLEPMESSNKLYRVVFVGEETDEHIPSFNELPVKRFDPLKLCVNTLNSIGEEVECTVELHGQLPWIWKTREGGWHTLVLTGSSKGPKYPDKYVLEPLLFYLFCLSGNKSLQWIGDSSITFHVVYEKDVKARTYNVTVEAARKYLETLVSDCLNQKKPEWLPFNTVTSRQIKPHTLTDDEIDEAKKEDFQVELKDAYAQEESYLIKLARPEVPVNAFDRVRERFRIFFNTID